LIENISPEIKDASAINSLNPSTFDWVHLLTSLTLQQDCYFLTMLPWAQVLSTRNLIRRTKAWCPLCYEGWRRHNMRMYEPLIWSLEVVTVCKYHQCPLEMRCPQCNCASFFLAPSCRPGYCSFCQRWLGEVSEQGFQCSVIDDEYRWQYWIANEVGAMLAAPPHMPASPQKEKFAAVVEMCLDEADGNVSAVSKKLRASRRTIRDWRHGTQGPQLDSLLRLCSILEISPLQVFSSDCRSIRASKGNGVGTAVNLGERTRKFYRVLDVEKIKGKLIAELQLEKESPTPMREVAKCLGYDQSFLYKHFPEICRAISSRYQVYRKRKREERKQKILDEVRQATFRVYGQNQYPSQERVRLLLTKPGSIKEPGALAVWHEALQDLGLENKEPQGHLLS
jgi:transcriptional regulator with XRE-family HTH domain